MCQFFVLFLILFLENYLLGVIIHFFILLKVTNGHHEGGTEEENGKKKHHKKKKSRHLERIVSFSQKKSTQKWLKIKQIVSHVVFWKMSSRPSLFFPYRNSCPRRKKKEAIKRNIEVKRFMFDPKIQWELLNNLKKQTRKNPDPNIIIKMEMDIMEAEKKLCHPSNKSTKYAKFVEKSLTWWKELWRKNPGGIKIASDAKLVTKHWGI